MDADKLKQFREKFIEFKNTDFYKNRKRQTQFAPIAKKIIEETLKNEPLNKIHLTGLIQTLKYNSKNKNFEKYLEINISNKTVLKRIKEEKYRLDLDGYTAAGKTAIVSISASQIRIVKDFLSKAFSVNDVDSAVKLVEEFESRKIPEIKHGIYSPWLHYINSEIFPIVNAPQKEFMNWIGMKKDYPSCIRSYSELKEITNEKHLGMLDTFGHTFAYRENKNSKKDSKENDLNEFEDIIENGSLNIILYGPPGTGKTYKSIELATIIAGDYYYETHEDYKAEFDRLKANGQIDFITFHQNYSYEDFVVGLRPDVDNEELRFRSHKGIFYNIAQRARENYELATNSKIPKKTFNEVFNEIVSPLENGDNVPIKMASGISYNITGLTEFSIYFEKPNGKSKHSLSIQTLQDIVEEKREAPRGLHVYYLPFAEKIKTLMKKKSERPKEDIKNYVLIIDEINRANISKVFGELITLLEKDKRLGEENELRVLLPNGEKDFCLPPNLYLLGTMNTADKSIALIDIALRRRFQFVGMYPDYDRLESDSKIGLLKQINTNIYSKKKSPDYLIGHSYFMNELPTIDIVRNNIIPLLIEYFSGKIDVVESIFEGTNMNVKFNSLEFIWEVKEI